MPRSVLDTSVLIKHWKQCGGDRADIMSAANGREWGLNLIKLRKTDLILSPVYLEFICGTRNKLEYQTAKDFLSVFKILDEWNILSTDLHDARRLAQRTPRNGRPRQLGDCLIRAMANRFGLEVDTLDSWFPR